MKKIGILIIALALLLVLSACGCEHEWKDAACGLPKTCTLCGEVEGEPGDHTWQDATCDAPKTCTLCGATEGEKLEHQWEETSACTIHCALCNAESPDAPGHQWVDATCTAAKSCSVCNLVEGEPLPHDWVDATCNVPKTCAVCATVEGEALGHTLADGNDGVTGTCTVCNKAIEYFYEEGKLFAWTEFDLAADGTMSNPVTYRRKNDTFVPISWYSDGKQVACESIGGSNKETRGISVDTFCAEGKVYYFVGYHSDNPDNVVRALMNAAAQRISFVTAYYSNVQYTAPMLVGYGGFMDPVGYVYAAKDAYGNLFAVVHKYSFDSPEDPAETWAVACDWQQ